MTALLFDPRVLLWIGIEVAVASLAAAALAWTGNPHFFRSFLGRWLCWFAPCMPLLLWGWVRIAEFYRVVGPAQ